MQAKLQREREELEREREQQEQAKSAVEEERQAQAKALQDQQDLLEKQRLEVENNRAQSEAEKEAKLKEFQEQQAELLKQQQEMERSRREEAEIRQAEQEAWRLREQELHDRADSISMTEQVLNQERHQILKSRTSLAVVQAHVVSMLGKADKQHGINEAKVHETHLLDADEPEAEDQEPANMADVWNMDWTAVETKEAPPAAEAAA